MAGRNHLVLLDGGPVTVSEEGSAPILKDAQIRSLREEMTHPAVSQAGLNGSWPRTHWAARIFRALFRVWRPRGFMRLGQAMATVLPAARLVPIRVGSEPLWVDMCSIDHQPAFLEGRWVYEPDVQLLLKRLAGTGQTILDVGANAGVMTSIFSEVVGDDGIVVAYEPNPGLLHRNAEGRRNVLVRPFAVSSEERTVHLRVGRASTMAHLVPGGGRISGDREVQSVTLDRERARLALSRVDLLKIDVEGFEAAVLSGAKGILSEADAPTVVFEWEPDLAEKGDLTPGDVAAKARIGGWCAWFLRKGQTLAPLGDWPSLPSGPGTVILIPEGRPECLTTVRELATVLPLTCAESRDP